MVERKSLQTVLNTMGALLSLATLAVGFFSLTGMLTYSTKTIAHIQTAYLYEVLASRFGVTKQSLGVSLMQIASRVFVSWCLCSEKNKKVTALMLVAWGVSDTMRFVYYMAPGVRSIRYLTSLLMYPIGVGCEAYLMLCKGGYIRVVGMLVYIPGFRYLYTRMKKKRERIDREVREVRNEER